MFPDILNRIANPVVRAKRIENLYPVLFVFLKKNIGSFERFKNKDRINIIHGSSGKLFSMNMVTGVYVVYDLSKT